jgi:hypothetical protein
MVEAFASSTVALYVSAHTINYTEGLGVLNKIIPEP